MRKRRLSSLGPYCDTINGRYYPQEYQHFFAAELKARLRDGDNGTMSMVAKNFFVLMVFALMASAGLAAQEKPKEGEKDRVATPDTQTLPPADAAGAPVDPNAYKIGPEDVVQIRVWREAELSGLFVVRPDGRITLPLAGELAVADLTPEQVRLQVVDLYGKYVNKPEVSVSLARVGSKKFYLVGMVMRTGVFPLVVPTTVLEAINAAGGFQEFANKKNVVILRGNRRLKFNYNDVIKGKNLDQNIQIENGDHIIVQ